MEEQLIEKAQKGDKQAFTDLVLGIKIELYKIAKSRITNESDIDDAIQETMIELFKSIKKLRDPKKFKMWAIKILINKCNKIYKKKHKKDISIDEYNVEKFIITNSFKEIEADINFYNLIKNLKYEERIIIILYYMEKYTTKEISKILHMKENTVKSHLFRAKKTIKIQLEGEKNYEINRWIYN